MLVHVFHIPNSSTAVVVLGFAPSGLVPVAAVCLVQVAVYLKLSSCTAPVAVCVDGAATLFHTCTSDACCSVHTQAAAECPLTSSHSMYRYQIPDTTYQVPVYFFFFYLTFPPSQPHLLPTAPTEALLERSESFPSILYCVYSSAWSSRTALCLCRQWSI